MIKNTGIPGMMPDGKKFFSHLGHKVKAKGEGRLQELEIIPGKCNK
jgi:hypothetical protein